MPIAELNYISARNITPDVETGIGSWSDDEIARAIREGVRKDGTALFSLMPYLDFATLDDEDVKAIVVYLRTIPPVRTGRVGGRILNHVMPFEWFRNMTDEDIGDIWAYLQTITPVKHRVSNTDPPTPCPVCNQSHGLGDLNVKP